MPRLRHGIKGIIHSLSTKVSENTAQRPVQLVHTTNSQFKFPMSPNSQEVKNVACLRSIVVCIPRPRSNEKSFYSVYRKPIHNSVSNNQGKKAVSDGQYRCNCRCPDNGSKTVLCEGACGQWYHLNCLKQDRKGKPMLKTQKWYCCSCIT